MAEQPREQMDADEGSQGVSREEQENYGGLSVEDDPDGTVDPADLAGSAGPDDAQVSYQPSASEADTL